jgi:hypothetical protein
MFTLGLKETCGQETCGNDVTGFAKAAASSTPASISHSQTKDCS